LNTNWLENKFAEVVKDPCERQRELIWTLPCVPIQEENENQGSEHVSITLEAEGSKDAV